MLEEVAIKYKQNHFSSLRKIYDIFIAILLLILSSNSYSQTNISEQDLVNWRKELTESVDKLTAIEVSFNSLIDGAGDDSGFAFSGRMLQQALGEVRKLLIPIQLLVDTYDPKDSSDIAVGKSYGFYIASLLELEEERLRFINSQFSHPYLANAIDSASVLIIGAKIISRRFQYNNF